MFVRPNPTGHSEIGDGSTQYLCMRIDRTIAVKSTENITSFGVVTEFIYFARSTSGAVGVLPLNPDLPEWAFAVLNIIAQQDVSPMTHINPTIATHCE